MPGFSALLQEREKVKRVQAALSPQHVFQNRSKTRHNPLPPFAVARLVVQTNGDESMRATRCSWQRVVPNKKGHAFSTRQHRSGRSQWTVPRQNLFAHFRARRRLETYRGSRKQFIITRRGLYSKASVTNRTSFRAAGVVPKVRGPKGRSSRARRFYPRCSFAVSMAVVLRLISQKAR